MKIRQVLLCIEQTPPPVLIFAEKQTNVDDVYEYLLLKGVEVAAIHGGKEMADRLQAVDLFKQKKKDVLAASYLNVWLASQFSQVRTKMTRWLPSWKLSVSHQDL